MAAAILKFDYNLPMVYCETDTPCWRPHADARPGLNRLDRLTSGVMVLGLTQEAARKNAHYFSPGGALRKEYVARCKGRFPECVSSSPARRRLTRA